MKKARKVSLELNKKVVSNFELSKIVGGSPRGTGGCTMGGGSQGCNWTDWGSCKCK
ncbi:hypothetical protein ACOKFD_05610 [Flagellimonas sp. S174]|uniref:hypothetical protein n=1 Tax=Flagellimonas sp. S174 TaxID=3410790 RepID=UPI003BF61A64